MSETQNHQNEQPEEVDLLLPWYVTGKLDADGNQAVSAQLAGDPDRRAQLEHIAEDFQASQVEHEALGAPGPAALDRLMARVHALEAVKPEAGMAARLRAWIGAIRSAFGQGYGGGMRFAATAAMLLIAVQAAFIGVLLNRPDTSPSTYKTVTETPAGTIASGPEIMVSFVPGARLEQVSTFLKDIECTVVDGPRAGGIYRVRAVAGAAATDPAELRDRLLARPDLVRFAAIAEPN